jgi:D-3-phosphoglycerate dehydrogenase
MGAGIDVMIKNPCQKEINKIFYPNALLTPHLGYVTAENYSIFIHK